MSEQDLNERIRFLEDRIAIYDVLASHPIASDSLDTEMLEAIYAEDTVFDRGPSLPGARRRADLLDLIATPAHKAAVEAGLVHYAGLPLVELHGDKAFATSYVMLIAGDAATGPRTLSNHGESNGYWIHRIVASRWTLERIDGRWQIKSRETRFHDGSDEARGLIGKARSYFQGGQRAAAATQDKA